MDSRFEPIAPVHPEAIPFVLGKGFSVDLHDVSSRQFNAFEIEYGWRFDNGVGRPFPDSRRRHRPVTESGIQYLRGLEQLEYLFMPGFLLTDRTMGTIESMPELRELHAIFGTPDDSVLERLSKLPLEKLSVGVVDAEFAMKTYLRRMTSLRTLQLLVFDSRFVESPNRKVVRRKLIQDIERTLPQCKIHVVFFASLPEIME